MHVYFARESYHMQCFRRPQVHVYFAPVSSAQITIKTHPPAAFRAIASSISMLPSSMFHKDGTEQNTTAHSALKAV